MSEIRRQCSKRVWDRCSRQATVERDGQPYCTQHDPERVAARREQERAAYYAEQKREAELERTTRELIERLGIGSLDYGATHKLTGGIRLTRRETEELVVLLTELRTISAGERRP